MVVSSERDKSRKQNDRLYITSLYSSTLPHSLTHSYPLSPHSNSHPRPHLGRLPQPVHDGSRNVVSACVVDALDVNHLHALLV